MNRIGRMATRTAWSTLAVSLLLLLVAITAARAVACPFCTPALPSMARQRESASLVVLAEYLGESDGDEQFMVRQISKGADQLKSLAAASGAYDAGTRTFEPATRLLPPSSKAGSLWMLFGQRSDAADAKLDWTTTNVDETSCAYFFRAPSLATPALERLPYFAHFLEHADPLIAADAYAEFAAAQYNEVRQVSDRFDMARIRGWLTDERVPDERKGFYGLALGMATNPAERVRNQQALRDAILPQSQLRQSDPNGGDFKPGLDGVLGGYLALKGPAALDFIDACFLKDKDAAEGNLRHVVTALRFAHEYLSELPRDRISASMRLLLPRPGFAPTAITDLARWRDTAGLAEIVALYRPTDERHRPIRRAVVGYLMTLSEAQSAEAPIDDDARIALVELRARDPGGVAEAERYHRHFGGFGATANTAGTQ